MYHYDALHEALSLKYQPYPERFMSLMVMCWLEERETSFNAKQPVAITIKSKSTLALVKIDSSIPSPNATMTQSSSSFVGKSSCRMKERRCDCGDLCRISVSRTSDNPGRKFRGCPNYKDPDGGCGYFKWLDEDDFVSSNNKWCRTQQRNTVTMLLTLIVGLLMAILICLVIVVIKM
ncbi:hypothetical protein LXL04_013439 [Taraxacum kok-saghyz]